MSASAAVAIGLAVADVVRVPRSRAITVAHLADMFGGGGLGGVPSILGGGLEFRQRPGIPPFGRIVRRPYRAQVLLGVVGSLAASPQFVWNARTVARISEAFDRVSDRWVPLTPDGFWDASEEFTDRLGLAPPTLRSALRAIRRRGGRAAQTMYGHSFFALLPNGRRRGELLAWLARHPVRAVEVPVARTGAARQRVAA